MDSAVHKKEQTEHMDNAKRIRLYVLIIAVLALLVGATTLVVPRGSGISRCGSLVQQNQYSCIDALAINTRNSSLCGLIHNYYSDTCYMAIAENTSNSELCSRISSKNLSYECFSSIAMNTGNPGICQSIGGQVGSSCLYQVSINTDNASSCSLINSASLSNNCKATVYLNSALSSGNASMCARIIGGGNTSATYSILGGSRIANYGQLYLNLSQFIEYEAYYNQSIGPADACYISLAFKSGNSAYCNNLSNKNLSSSCGVLITKNVTTNSNSTINYTAIINGCQANGNQCNYTSQYLKAILSNNVSVCKTIPAPQSYQCYFSFASRYNNTSYCNFIANSTLNSDCVMSVRGAFVNST